MTDEYGELHVEADQDGTITITRADPRIRIAWEYLHDHAHAWTLFFGGSARAVLDTGGNIDGLLGSTLEVKGANARYIYKITGYDYFSNCYLAEWPD